MLETPSASALSSSLASSLKVNLEVPSVESLALEQPTLLKLACETPSKEQVNEFTTRLPAFRFEEPSSIAASPEPDHSAKSIVDTPLASSVSLLLQLLGTVTVS